MELCINTVNPLIHDAKIVLFKSLTKCFSLNRKGIFPILKGEIPTFTPYETTKYNFAHNEV